MLPCTRKGWCLEACGSRSSYDCKRISGRASVPGIIEWGEPCASCRSDEHAVADEIEIPALRQFVFPTVWLLDGLSFAQVDVRRKLAHSPHGIRRVRGSQADESSRKPDSCN